VTDSVGKVGPGHAGFVYSENVSMLD